MNDIAYDSAAFDSQSRGQTVLIIDDDPVNLDTITDHLAGYGLEISIAQTGETGLERACMIQPDLILLDVLMPGIDGFETCRRLKSDAATRDIPVIFMTALTETEHKVEGFRVGAVDYIIKPIRKEEVLARVLTHLRLRELAQDLEQKIRERTDELTTANRQLEREIADRVRAETSLRESEEKYRNLVEQANDGILIVQDTLLKYASRRVAKMSGYTIKELMDKPFTDYVHPDELDRVVGYYQMRMTGEAIPSIYESAIRHKDGHRMDVEFNISTTLYQGSPAELVVVRDITERKQSEDALRESEHYLVEAQSMARLGYWKLVPETTQISGSDELFDIFGLTREQATLDVFVETVHPDDREYDLYHITRGMEHGEPWDIEHRLICRDGTLKHVHAKGEAITDEAGKVVLLMGTVQDITERKQAEEEREQLLAQVQEQAHQVQQIMDTVPEGVFLLDAGGRILLANPMARKNLAALSVAEVGDTLTRLGDRPLEELLTSPPKGLWHDVTVDEQSFQVIARSIQIGPTPGGWVLVIRDVTHQREFDRRIQQQERLAAIGQLAAGIAHDFNNIMATIVLYAQMTMRTPDIPTRIRERMATVNRQAQHATNLIRQILDFSRRTDLERQPLDLLSLLKEQIQLLERTLPENIEIKLTHEPGEYIVDADFTSIQQIMTNLAINARDAMPQGGEFHVEMEWMQVGEYRTAPLPEMGDGEWLQIVVSDTRTGIPPDILPHIFDPFFTTKDLGKGSGLGLSQVHGIVGQHEGYIDVKTQPGRGTTFTIYLPALQTDPPEPSDGALFDELSPLVRGRGEMILVVEDNAATRQAVVESLELLNYQVLEAGNGREALEVLEQRGEEIALVLSDVVMPEMGGITLLHALRQRGIDVGVVMMTGHPLQDELDDLHAQGMLDWLPKPPSVAKLAKVVAQALKGIDD